MGLISQASPQPPPYAQSVSSADRQSITHPWRPPTLKKRFLISTAILSFALATFLIILQYLDKRNGALIYVNADDNFSAAQGFLFRYLPTVLLVAYGVIIAAIDLDIKRLEPWYLLSSKDHVAGKQAMTMTYDVDFIANTILNALRNRHWNIVLSSVMFVLATLIVPTVQNAMFITGPASIKSTGPVLLQSELIPLSQQVSAMSSNFLNSAYAIQWLGQALPSFTSRSFAIAPFADSTQQTTGVSLDSNHTTLTAPSVRYWTEIECFEPVSSDVRGSEVIFNDGHGCHAENFVGQIDPLANPKYKARYLGYEIPGTLMGDPLLQPDCDRLAIAFFAAWTANIGNSSRPTAIFCNTSYFSEPVIATVTIPDASIISYNSTGVPQELGHEIFNRTHFEAILALGRPPDTKVLFDEQSSDNRDFADAARIEPDARLQSMNIASPVPATIGFALGSNKLDGQAYLNKDVLESSLAAAHQLLFALAISKIIATPTKSVDAEQTVNTTAVRIISGFNMATVVMIGAIGLICLFLARIYAKRPLKLSCNPESLGAVAYLGTNQQIQDAFLGVSTHSDRELKTHIDHYGFHMASDGFGKATIKTVNLGLNDQTSTLVTQRSRTLQYTLPREISYWSVGFVACALFACFATLLSLYYVALRSEGLPLPAQGTFGQQVLLNLLPTSFSTLVAAYMALICRIASFLQPLEELNNKYGAPRESLLADYTSLPPQLILTSAIPRRKWLLSYLSLLSVVVNVLTVTMSGLFSVSLQKVSLETSALVKFEPVIEPTLNSEMAEILSNSNDIYYIALPNTTNATRLPAWTIPEYSFLPVDFREVDHTSEEDIYSLKLTGFGADLACEDLLASDPAAFEFHPDGHWFRLTPSYTDSQGSHGLCLFNSNDLPISFTVVLDDDPDRVPWNSTLANEGFTRIEGPTKYPSSLEISNYMRGALLLGSLVTDEACGSMIIKGWVRGRWIEDADKQASPEEKPSSGLFQHEETIISCRPRLRTQDFRVSSSANGSIVDAQPLGAFSYIAAEAVDFSHALNSTTRAFNTEYNIPFWHNDTIARDYFNNYAKEYLSDPRLIEANRSLPSLEEATAIASQLYARLFAIQLSLEQSMLREVQSSQAQNIQAERFTTESRVVISKPMFVITEAILGLSLVGLLVFRLSLSRPFLPRMPFTIASQLAYFSGSKAVSDMTLLVEARLTGVDDRKQSKEELKAARKVLYKKTENDLGSDVRYGFGKFIGTDGRVHVGIECEAFVTRISGTSTAGRKRLKRANHDTSQEDV